MNIKKIKYWLKTPAGVRRQNAGEYRALCMKYGVAKNKYARALNRISVDLDYYENPADVSGCVKFKILEKVPGVKYTTTHTCPHFIHGVPCKQQDCPLRAANNECAQLYTVCELALNKKAIFWENIYSKVR